MDTIPFGALPILRDIRDFKVDISSRETLGALPILRDILDFKVDIIQATTVRPPS